MNSKPAPDCFLEAARLIGVPSELCVGYEDAVLGLEAIRHIPSFASSHPFLPSLTLPCTFQVACSRVIGFNVCAATLHGRPSSPCTHVRAEVIGLPSKALLRFGGRRVLSRMPTQLRDPPLPALPVDRDP